MARHAQPRALAELKGAVRKDPQRYKFRPPPSGPLGEPPEHLSEAVHACWLELASMVPSGVLTAADRIALEIASELLAQLRENPKQFPASKLTNLTSCLARLGITTADRQRIDVLADGDDGGRGGDFDAF
jgi:hypothetical protein